MSASSNYTNITCLMTPFSVLMPHNTPSAAVSPLPLTGRQWSGNVLQRCSTLQAAAAEDRITIFGCSYWIRFFKAHNLIYPRTLHGYSSAPAARTSLATPTTHATHIRRFQWLNASIQYPLLTQSASLSIIPVPTLQQNEKANTLYNSIFNFWYIKRWKQWKHWKIMSGKHISKYCFK